MPLLWSALKPFVVVEYHPRMSSSSPYPAHLLPTVCSLYVA
ncbi:MAG: hypothetical protein R6W93_15630 [Candidatus Limnocylindrales bacterium]|jgi:hypothetical protein